MEKIKLNPLSFNQNSIWPSVRHRSWNLEATILLLLGIACLYSYNILHELGVIGETIILVVFLSGLMGITRIEIPQTLPKYLYPIFSGIASMFMDSFLVLLMVSKLNIEGTEEEKLKFKAYNMVAALIGGVGTYFGEVYLLPLALQYQNGNQWYTMLPILPPILLFLFILSYLTKYNNVSITPTSTGRSFTNGDIAEFVIFIMLLFVLHNPILLLGLLLIYAYITGQGIDLIEVIKTEAEASVLMLLFAALLMGEHLMPFIVQFSGWWAFIPASINAVVTGVLYPANNQFWYETLILTTAVLLTPLSSLVGVMVFKNIKDWFGYMKLSIPLMAAWFVIAGAWIHFGLYQFGWSKSFYHLLGAEEPTLKTMNIENNEHSLTEKVTESH